MFGYVAHEEEVETINDHTLKLEIVPDDQPESPREWDNLGRMVCFHRRYNLGDFKEHYDLPDGVVYLAGDYYETHGCGTFSDVDHAVQFADEVVKRGGVVLPLYLYDHSGLSMSTGAFSCPWDSGQVGFIFCTAEAIRKEYGRKRITKKLRAEVERILRGEVETYDQFLRGDVYGYVIVDENEEHLDSCFGYYGLDYAIEEGRSMLEYWREHYVPAGDFEAIPKL